MIGIFGWVLFAAQAPAQKASQHYRAPATEKKWSDRAITVADAISMARFLGFSEAGPAPKDNAALFSPDGTRFLILEERGDLEKNTRVYSLFLFRSDAALQSAGSHLLISFSSSSNRPGIQHVQWLGNRSIAFLAENPGEQQELYTMDCDTKHLARLTNHETSLTSYAIDRNDGKVYYTAQKKSQPLFDPRDVAQAVVVSNQPLSDLLAGEDRYWSKVTNELFWQSDSGNEVRLDTKGDLINEDSLWLSPNGQYLVVKTSVKEVPKDWDYYQDPLIRLETRQKSFKGSFTFVYQYELIETDSGRTEVLINAPLANGDSEVIWSSDSRAVVVSGTYLPLDSSGPIQQNRRKSTPFVVEVNIPNRELLPVTSNNLTLLGLEAAGTKLLVQDSEGLLKAFERAKDSAHWKQISTGEPSRKEYHRIEITVEEDKNTPPKLFATDYKTKQKYLLIDPNPQFEGTNLGSVEEVNFKSSDGHQVKAGIYKPPNYTPGKRYPLVIQTHGWDPQRFWIDGPYSTAYAARPLASKGFIVLQLDDEDWSKLGTSEEVKEAMATYEGGIDYLDGLGLIDRHRVGIIGFSRSGLFVEYALTHSKYHFAAASLADISDGGYFRYLALLNLSSGFASDCEGINGGLPFSGGLASWAKNSPGFNLNRVTTPVRLEADSNSFSLFFEWEWFAGLSRLMKPVELIYLPSGDHPLVKPWERMTSQQGNVDWFSFWLEGEQDSDPAKSERYARWRNMRETRTAE